MGNPASTRQRRRRRRTTVEECRVLPVRAFTRRGLFPAEEKQRGVARWVNRRTDEAEASLIFEVAPHPRSHRLWLFYALPHASQPIGYPVEMDTTPCNFGGVRWWFRCPSQTASEEGCNGRRCGKLYMPPGETRYLCRECHDLTYRSCQESNEPGRLERMIAERSGYEATRIKHALDGSWRRRNTRIVVSTGS